MHQSWEPQSKAVETLRSFSITGIKFNDIFQTVPKIIVYVQRSCGANMIYIERCDFHPIFGHIRKCQKISNCVCDVQHYFASDGLCLKMPTTTISLTQLAKEAKMAVRILQRMKSQNFSYFMVILDIHRSQKNVK